MNEKKSNSSIPTSAATTAPPKRGLAAWLWATLGGGVLLLGLGGFGAYAYASQADTILRGVWVGDVPVGRQTNLAALELLQQRWKKFSDQGFSVHHDTAKKTFPILSSADDETILELADFDPIQAADQAFDLGHRGSWWRRVWERNIALFGYQQSVGSFTLASDSLKGLIEQNFGQADQDPANASLTLDTTGQPVITPSILGQGMNYGLALADARARLRSLSVSPILLETTVIQPTIPSTPKLQTIAATEVPALLKKMPITLTAQDQTWQIDVAQAKVLLGFVTINRQVRVGFDPAKTAAFFDLIRPSIDIKARDAKFSLASGRVTTFQTSVVGKTLNATASTAALNQAVLEQDAKTVALVVDETKPLTDTVSTNDLGITELVGEATTDFRGSPPNRVFNLSLGAERLHGLLIEPGETFSLVEALGSIDQAHGWKSELVIKGPKITPEFGGGLCQVATTLFRTILNAGLPVVERHNHSLRISYYEPPIGLDATIYEPKPDLRFTNDYRHALLLQTRVEGTKLTFSFYGTKDARTVDIPEPKVFNRVPIPPTETTEVDDLPPGKEVCQNGHPGADAIATYTVTKAGQPAVTQTFTSHYRALPKICRVGKQPTAPAPIPAPITNSNTNTSP